MRADAQRNRDRILAAARELVVEAGVDVGMDDIARRAGVAVGTLYRHFPAKSDLINAVVDDSFDQIAARTERALVEVEAGAPVAEKLAELFRAVAERHVTDRALKVAADRLDVEAEFARAVPGTHAGRAVAAITRLLDLAHAAGVLRAGVTLADLMLLLSSMPGGEVPAEMRHRFVEIVIAGLAAPAHP
ncbi:TetR/AcrR family transcriptional regulator [Pseudonocardia sp. GCM10023141]|uniref:TetR/AcrR family transcriptional regulator n=1 Tax=Pseudonocardia sp. GCM10023141 TaxID=3252653 RepID=UPI0036225AF4